MSSSNKQQYTGLIPEWIANNDHFAKETFPTLEAPWKMEGRRQMVKDSGQMTLVLTCLDPRCVPETFFGPSFQGGVIRNAGGRASDDAIRSMAVLRELAGLKTVAVIHHSDCGVTHLQPQEITETVGHDENGKEVDFKLFTTEEFNAGTSVREDVRALRQAAVLQGVNVFGFKLDTFTGKLEPVNV